MKWYSYKFYKMFKTICDKYLEASWNNNWPKANIMFVTETGMPAQNVRTKLNCISKTVEEKIKAKALAITSCTQENDEKVFLLFNWVYQNIKYVQDSQSHLKVDFWQTPDETWSRKTGDCEDHTLLLMKMTELAGVPVWRMKACCGYIAFNDKKFGHCYPIYLREEYNEWALLDTTFYTRLCVDDWSNGLRHLESAAQKASYNEIWFCFNRDYGFAQKDILLKPNGEIMEELMEVTGKGGFDGEVKGIE